MAAAASERRVLVALVFATLVPFALLAAWARIASPAPWEPAILAALTIGQGAAAEVVIVINELGNLPMWAAVVAVLSGAALVARRTAAAVLLALSFFSDLAAFVVKLLVERVRPDTAAAEHLIGPDSFAYPSGHVVRAVALAAVAAWLVAPRAARLPAALIAGLGAGTVMGYARVALNVHWPTDAIGGVLLGIGWFSITVLAVARAPAQRAAE